MTELEAVGLADPGLSVLLAIWWPAAAHGHCTGNCNKMDPMLYWTRSRQGRIAPGGRGAIDYLATFQSGMTMLLVTHNIAFAKRAD